MLPFYYPTIIPRISQRIGFASPRLARELPEKAHEGSEWD